MLRQSGGQNFLQKWDHANTAIRIRILENFIRENKGKTAQALEASIGNVASLFLARLTLLLKLR